MEALINALLRERQEKSVIAYFDDCTITTNWHGYCPETTVCALPSLIR